MKHLAIFTVILLAITTTQAQEKGRLFDIPVNDLENYRPSSSVHNRCESEFLFMTNQNFPTGVATDGNRFWVTGFEGSILDGINPGDERTTYYEADGTFIDVLDFPDIEFPIFGGAMIQEDTLWVVSENVAKLYGVNKMTGDLFVEYDLPTLGEIDPNSYGIAFDGTYLWNSEYHSNSLSYLYKIDPSTGAALDTLTINLTSLLPIEFIDGQLYGLSRAVMELHTIDLTTGATEFVMDWCLEFPYGIAYDAQTGFLYGTSSAIEFGGEEAVYKVAEFDVETSTFVPVQHLDFTISPNPASTYVNIELSTTEKTEIQIFNTSGQLMKVTQFLGTSHQLDIHDLPIGTYYIQVKTEQAVGMQPLIKTNKN